MSVTALFVSLMIACGGDSPDKSLSAAQGSLASGAYAEAITAAEAGLSTSPEAAMRWRLEFVKLEALARSGDGAKAAATLEALAAEPSSQIKASHYVSTADQLRSAGDAAGAISLLDAGAKRYPSDATIAKAIEQAKASGGSDELEALRSLGYIE